MRTILSYVYQFGVASLLVGFAVFLTPWIDTNIGVEFHFVLFLLCVLLTTWFVSTASSLFTVLLIVIVTYVPIYRDASLPLDSIVRQIAVITAVGLFINALAVRLKKRAGSSKKQADYLRLLVEHHPHPVFFLEKTPDKETDYNVASPVSDKYAPITGRGLATRIHEDDKTRFEEFLVKIGSNVLETGSIDLRIKGQTGKGMKWVRIDAVNLLHEPTVGDILFSIQDITIQKDIEEERIRSLEREHSARKIAEEAVKSRDEFLSIASHELKTPLTTVILQLQSTIKQTLTVSLANFSGEKLVRSLRIVEDQSQRLSNLIKDLLNVSLVSTGRLELEKKKSDLSLIMESLVGRFEEQFNTANTPHYFSKSGPIIGNWDEIRIEQAVSNLLTNALKFGKGKPIYIKAKKEGNRAIISVKDNGTGIPLEDQKHIFDLFHTTAKKTGKKGLGVGLYIAQKIAQSHSGYIEVKSEVDKGTEFIITLPL